jgi:hypothetical protein
VHADRTRRLTPLGSPVLRDGSVAPLAGHPAKCDPRMGLPHRDHQPRFDKRFILCTFGGRQLAELALVRQVRDPLIVRVTESEADQILRDLAGERVLWRSE